MKKWLPIKSFLTNERGMALVVVLLFLTVFSVLGLSLLSLSINNVKMSAQERDHESVYYVAEAGAAKAYTQIEQAVIEIKETIESPEEVDFYAAVEARILSPNAVYSSPDFEEGFGETPSAAISVIKLGARTYQILSVGTIGGESRTVKQTFLVNWQEPKKFAVYANHYSFNKGGGNIIGNIGLSSTSSTFTDASGAASVSGEVYVPKGWPGGSILGKIPSPYEGTVQVMLPAFPAAPSDYKQDKSKLILNNKYMSETWILTDNQKLTEISISQNAILTIDTQTSDKAIVVDSLSMASGVINVIGSGKLTIHIRKSFSMQSSSRINFNKNTLADTKKLIMYLEDDKVTAEIPSVSIGGSNKIYGSLYAENATMSLGGSGVIEGHVFTGGTSVTVGNSAEVGSDLYPSLFYAPNADFSITNGAEVHGLIVANKFDGSGGKVYMDDILYNSLPYPVRPVRPVLKEGLLTKDPAREAE